MLTARLISENTSASPKWNVISLLAELVVIGSRASTADKMPLGTLRMIPSRMMATSRRHHSAGAPTSRPEALYPGAEPGGPYCGEIGGSSDIAPEVSLDLR